MSLHNAAEQGDNARILRLIGEGHDVNGVDQHGSTPLMVACESERASLETIQLLVANGADVHLENEYGKPALRFAVSRGSLEVVRFLVEHGADPLKTDKYGNELSSTVSAEVVEYLLKLGVDPNTIDEEGYTAYTRAIERGLDEIAEILGNVTQPIYPPTWDELGIAVSKNDEVGVARILAGRSLKDTNKKQYEWLVSNCCCYDNPSMLKLLADAGLSLKRKHWWRVSTLHVASSMGACKVAQWLIKRGFDVNSKDRSSETPLFAARSCEMIQLLIDSGATVDFKNHVEETPLLDARSVEVVDLLIKNGADYEYIGGQGSSLLMFAAERGYVDIVRYLLGVGANPNTTNYGQSALQKAAASDELEIVQLLLDAGADPNMQDPDDWDGTNELPYS